VTSPCGAVRWWLLRVPLLETDRSVALLGRPNRNQRDRGTCPIALPLVNRRQTFGGFVQASRRRLCSSRAFSFGVDEPAGIEHRSRLHTKQFAPRRPCTGAVPDRLRRGGVPTAAGISSDLSMGLIPSCEDPRSATA